MVDSDRIVAYAVLGFLGLILLLMFLVGNCAYRHGLRVGRTPGHETSEVDIEHGGHQSQDSTV